MSLSYRSTASIVAATLLLAGLLFFGLQHSQAGVTVQPVWNLKTGWNMVSIPVSGSGPTLSDISQRCGQNTTFYRWNAAANKYDTFSTMTPGHGYWVRATQNCTVAIPGTTPWTGSVSLPGAGWHMIGTPAGGIAPEDIGGNCQISSIQKRDPSLGSDGQYVVVRDRLESGLGYFVRVSGACNLVFSESGTTPPGDTTPPAGSSPVTGTGLIGQGNGKVAETYYEDDFAPPSIVCGVHPDWLFNKPLSADFNSSNAMVVEITGAYWYDPVYLFRDNQPLGQLPTWWGRLCKPDDPGLARGLCHGGPDMRQFSDRGLTPSTSYLYALRKGPSSNSSLVAAVYCETTASPEHFTRYTPHDYEHNQYTGTRRKTGGVQAPDTKQLPENRLDAMMVSARTVEATTAYLFRGGEMLVQLAEPKPEPGRSAPGWLIGQIFDQSLEAGSCYMYYVREGSAPNSNLLAAQVGCTADVGTKLSCRKSSADKITIDWETRKMSSPVLIAYPDNTYVHSNNRNPSYKIANLPATGKEAKDFSWEHPATVGVTMKVITPMVEIRDADNKIWASAKCQ